MVIVDDTNRIFLAQMDCTRETTQVEAVRFLDPFAERHFRNCGGRNPMRITIYRLPRGDYSGGRYEFFDAPGGVSVVYNEWRSAHTGLSRRALRPAAAGP